MASRRHRIDPDARSGGESWVHRPFEPSRQRRWVDSLPPSVSRKGHACGVVAPRRGVLNTASSRRLAFMPFPTHREAISFQAEPKVTHNRGLGLDQLERLGVVGNAHSAKAIRVVRNILLRTSSKWSIQVGRLHRCPTGNRGHRTRMSMNSRHEAGSNVHGFRTTTHGGSGMRATAIPCLDSGCGGRNNTAPLRRSCSDNALIGLAGSTAGQKPS